MPSRKRAKGRQRKLKAAAEAAAGTRYRWEYWVRGGEQSGVGARCNHGCDIIPDPDHPVSSFMNDLGGEAVLNEMKEELNCVFDHIFERNMLEKKFVFKQHPAVWNDPSLRKIAADLLIAMGTNMFLEGIEGIKVAASGHTLHCMATTILLLQHYDESHEAEVGGWHSAEIAAMRASCLVRDIP